MQTAAIDDGVSVFESVRPRLFGIAYRMLLTGNLQDQRLYGLDAWQESPYYSDRERAALTWTEAVTNIQEGHVSDSVYEQVREFFTEKELSDLTLAVAAINSWNRLNIALRTVPGTYRPAKATNAK